MVLPRERERREKMRIINLFGCCCCWWWWWGGIAEIKSKRKEMDGTAPLNSSWKALRRRQRHQLCRSRVTRCFSTASARWSQLLLLLRRAPPLPPKDMCTRGHSCEYSGALFDSPYVEHVRTLRVNGLVYAKSWYVTQRRWSIACLRAPPW